MLHLTDENFDSEVLKSAVPVFVDFYADWCGPCQMLGPIVEDLAKEFEGKNIKIVKVNVDQANATAMKFDIMSIPTMIFFKNGQPVETIMGAQSKDALKAKLESYL